MKNIIKVLENNGAMLSSDIAEEVSKTTGENHATIRRKISRECTKKDALLGHLNLKFPHKENFIYLKSQGFNEEFFTNLKNAANKTRSVYSYILNAFDCTNGVIKYNKACILSGSPSKIKGHIGYNTIIENLKKLNLCSEVIFNGNPYLHYSINTNRTAALAQEKIEEHLIEMIKDWIVKNSFSSSGVLMKNDEYASFKWDITAPSYLYFIRKNEKPGFIVVDVIYNTIDENAIRYFINKINITKNLKNVPKAIPILLGKYFTPEALNLAKQQGIIATTPANLFGLSTANLFENLFKVLINAGTIAAENFAQFMELFNKLDAIKGASLNLAGDLFEFVVGHCYKKIEGGSLDIGRVIKYDGQEKEFDVILRTDRNEHYYIECKGYGRSHLVDQAEVKKFLDKISFVRDWYKSLKPTEQPRFKFGYITTSDFDDDARALLENYKNRTTKYDIFYMNGKNFSDLVKSSNITDASNIINVLNQHYFKIDL